MFSRFINVGQKKKKTLLIKSTDAPMDEILNISGMDFCRGPPPLLKDAERRQRAAGLIHDWLPGAKPQPPPFGCSSAQSGSCWRRLGLCAGGSLQLLRMEKS